MSRFKASDLLDQKFGDLTVISRAPNGKNGQAQWNCTCSCGGKRIVESARLNDGKIKHCGCKNKTPTPFINLVGEKFGKLIIISREKNNKRSVQYNCRCECGNKRIVFAESLKNGEINSCKTCHVSRKLIDITGQKIWKINGPLSCS